MAQFFSRVIIPFSQQLYVVDAPNMETAIELIEKRIALNRADIRIVRELTPQDIAQMQLADLQSGQVRQVFL